MSVYRMTFEATGGLANGHDAADLRRTKPEQTHHGVPGFALSLLRRCRMLFIAKDVVGRRLCDRNGQPAGRVAALDCYPPELDAPGGAAAVIKGRIVRSTQLVDLHDAVLDGDTVVAAYPIVLITAAPNHRALLGDTLSDRHAAEVLQHYRGSASPT